MRVRLEGIVLVGLLAVACLLPSSARAALEAHIFVDRITNIGQLWGTDSNDYFEENAGVHFGEEPYWHLAILDVDMFTLPESADITPYASLFSEFTCANWDVTSTLIVNQDFSRVIPGQQTAWFYVGVYDYDNWLTNNLSGTFLAETLGDHHVSGSNNFLASPGQLNNNDSRWHLAGTNGTWCGDSPLGTGEPEGNWRIQYRTYYIDTTAPSSATAPSHSDGDAPAGFNNDAIITFTWTRGADADSGIRQRIRIQRTGDGQTCEVALQNTDASYNFTGTATCSGGTLGSLTLQEGQTYRAQIDTLNGNFPTVDNPSTVTSGYSVSITQNAVAPTTSITAPDAGSWRNGTFSVSVDDSANATTCHQRVNGGDWTTRTCDASFNVTVGATAACATAGVNTCAVEVRATSAGSLTGTASRSFSIDFLAEPVSGATLLAWQSSAKVVSIPAGGWQADASPYFEWSNPLSGAGLSAYERGFSATEPACGALSTSTSASFTQVGDLADGVHPFWVRVRDVAGNCSDAVAFDFRVDRSGDSTGPITAWPFSGAPSTISAATWQTDNAPHFTWSAVTGTHAPVTGYAVGWGSEPSNCATTQVGTSFTVGGADARLDGVHTFNVRARDQAGNCGPASSFVLWVDNQSEAISSLTIEDATGGPIAAASWTNEDQPTFRWTATSSAGNTLGFSRRIGADSPTFDADCVSEGAATSHTPAALASGKHRFSVRAVDPAGNCGTPSAVEVWVDVHAESITGLTLLADGSVTNPATPIRDATPGFSWGSDRVAANEAPAGYSVALDLASWANLPCTAAQTGTTFDVSAALGDGSHTFGIRAVDQAGNCGPVQTVTFTVDTQAPSVVSLSAFDGSATLNPIGAATWQRDRDPYLTWALTTPEAGVTYRVTVDAVGEPSCAADQSATSFTFATNALADGQHTVDVRAVDVAGNCSAAARIALYVDATPDAITGLGAYTRDPAEGGVPIAPAAPQSDTDPWFGWTTTGTVAPIAGYFVSLSGGAGCNPGESPDVTTPAFQVAPPLADGTYTFRVAALDAAGNCGPESPLVVVVLASAPTVTFLDAVPNPARADLDVTVRFQVDRTLSATPTVSVSGGAATFVGAEGGTYTFRYHTLGTEPEGARPIAIQIQDLAGNPGSGAGNVVFDFTPPSLGAFAANPPVVTTGQTSVLSIDTSEPLLSAPTVTVGGVPASAFAPELVGNTWRSGYLVLGTEAEGAGTVNITATDLAGNPRTASGRLDFDFTPPAVALVFPAYREVLDIGTTVELGWLTTDANPAIVALELSLDGGESFALLAGSVPDTGTHPWTVDASETTDARLRVTATDRAGLTGATTSTTSFRIRVPTADHLILTAAEPATVVGDPVAVSLQVVDALSDPVAQPVAVTVTVDGSGRILETTLTGATADGQTVTGTTGATGTATITITSDVAEVIRIDGDDSLPRVVPHRSTTVSFEPSTADHLVAFADDGVAGLGQVEPILVQLVDRHGNAVSQAVPMHLQVSGDAVIVATSLAGAEGTGTTAVAGTTAPDGSATFQVRDYSAELVTVSPGSSSEILTLHEDHEPTAVTFSDIGGVDPFASRLTVAPFRVYADDEAVSIVTVEPLDDTGARVGEGLDVVVEASYGTLDEVRDEGDGTYTTALSSDRCEAQPAVVSATVEGVRLATTAEVEFTCDEVTDAVLSADPERIPGDGSRCATLTVTPLDDEGEPLPAGQAVQLTPNLGEVGPVEDLGNGSYAAQLCSSECNDREAAVIDVAVNGVSLASLDDDLRFRVQVLCVAVDPALSTLTAAPAEIIADGQDAATITVTPIDPLGTALGTGLTVAIEATLGELTAVEDVGDGTYVARLTSTDAGTAEISARVGGVEIDATAQVALLPSTPSAISPTALTLTQSVQGGEGTAGSTALIAARVASTIGTDVDGVYLRLALDEGLTLLADRVFVGADAVAPVQDGGGWRIDVGRVAARLGMDSPADALTVRYEVAIDAGASGSRIAAMQAFSAAQAAGISEVDRLTIAIGEASQTLASAEACGCNSRGDASTALAALPILALLALRRRRRVAP